jgi:hypothetical protein
LFGAIFGLTEFRDIIEGIEIWVKDGTLPDGSKGVPVAGKIEISPGEVLEARDDEEKELISEIRRLQNVLEWVKAQEGDPYRDNPPGRKVKIITDDEPTGVTDWDKYNARQVANCEMFLAGTKSKFWAHRWIKAVEETQADRDEIAKFFAELRGLSPDVFKWLIDNAYTAIYTSEKTTKDGARKWTDHEIAFPVFRTVDWTAWPIEADIEFLGMHLKWIKNKDKSGWRYEPKGRPVQPLIIGDITAAELVIVAESTWDPIAYLDDTKLYETDTAWAVVITRGAGNAKLFPGHLVRPDATVFALAQNDETNQHWVNELAKLAQRPIQVIRPPAEVKDYNDYVKAKNL